MIILHFSQWYFWGRYVHDSWREDESGGKVGRGRKRQVRTNSPMVLINQKGIANFFENFDSIENIDSDVCLCPVWWRAIILRTKDLKKVIRVQDKNNLSARVCYLIETIPKTDYSLDIHHLCIFETLPRSRSRTLIRFRSRLDKIIVQVGAHNLAESQQLVRTLVYRLHY